MLRSTVLAKTRVKICCVANAEELTLAVSVGASAVGLVSAMPSGPGVISEEDIAALAAITPPPVLSVLLTSLTELADLLAQQHRCRASALQLCDAVTATTRRSLRQALPDVRIIQVIHVQGAASVDEAHEAAETCDASLLDSGRPAAEPRTLGGTGNTHDWQVSRAIREAADVPVFLAGGLNAENVGGAIRVVRPFGADVCSSVRIGGQLDPERLRRFIEAVRSA